MSDVAGFPVWSGGGVTWRPPSVDDVPGLVVLHDACYDVDATYRESDVEIRDRWRSPSADPERDALIGVAEDGSIVASIWTYVPPGAETTLRSFGFMNRIHPAWRTAEMRSFVLGWWEARSVERFDEIGGDLPRVLRDGYFDHQVTEIEFLITSGYEVVRYFHELIRDLTDPVPDVQSLDGIDIGRITEPTADLLDVHNAAFRDHWGSEPWTAESMSHAFDGFFLTDASFIAYDGDVPVAFTLSAAYPHEFDDLGWPHGWIESVGTRRSHRKRGLATALITEAMRAMQARGYERALLGVDAENPTGAYGVYERMGFTERRREVSLQKDV